MYFWTRDMSTELPNENQTNPAEAAAQGCQTPEPKTGDAAGSPTPTPAPACAEPVDPMAKKAALADEYWERLLRQAAEFENFKKRAARDRQDAVRFANEALLEKLVSVLDHFDAALAAALKTENCSMDSFKTGISLIHAQLRSVVMDAGLEEIEALHQPFDPKWHEAVSQIESAEVPDGQVVQQLRKGYKLRDRLLRPASVVVAHPPAA
jgi:molecular chaperone GrpE